MNFLKTIFSPFVAVVHFINTYFKTVLFFIIIYLIFYNNAEDMPTSKPNLAVLEIHGAIMDPTKTLEQIESLRKNKDIKGVLVHVDSPGGSLSSSVEVMMALKELKLDKNLVAYAAGSMTSGSYYAVIHSNKIIANPGSFIGSIGVVMQGYNFEELAQKIGVKEQSVSAGAYKQMGSMARTWSEPERKALQKLADDSYRMFVNDVKIARGLTNDKEFADAKVFLAREALSVGLIDSVGSLNQAKDELIALSNITDPVWQKQNQWEKTLDRLTNQAVSKVTMALFGLKAY